MCALAVRHRRTRSLVPVALTHHTLSSTSPVLVGTLGAFPFLLTSAIVRCRFLLRPHSQPVVVAGGVSRWLRREGADCLLPSTHCSRAGHVVQVSRSIVENTISNTSTSTTAAAAPPSCHCSAARTTLAAAADPGRELVVATECAAHCAVFRVGPVPVRTHRADPL